MTEQGFNELAGKKVSSLLPTLSLSKHYTTPLPQISPPPTQNPTPSSSKENLSITKTPDSVFQRVGFARLGYALQSLINKETRGIFKEESERDRAFGGESKVLPRLMRRGFEGDQTTLPLASEMGVKKPLKACGNDGSMGMDTNQGVERRKPQECSVNEGWERKGVEKDYAMCICNKGLWDNHQSANIVKKRKCSVDEDLRARGWRKTMAICIYYKGLEGNCTTIITVSEEGMQ